MRESILSSVLDVCQNIFDSQFLGAMADSQFGISSTLGALRERRVEFIRRPWMRRSDSPGWNPVAPAPSAFTTSDHSPTLRAGVVISACNVQAANSSYSIRHAALAPSGAYP
jgi:hypothetical protein